MELAKFIHVVCAYTTGIGFLFRGILAIYRPNLLNVKWVKTLPHAVDTLLLFSGLFMVITWALLPSIHIWLLAKMVALLIYIAFGLIMLRWGHSERRRWFGLIGGMLIYLYVVGVAHSKSASFIFGGF